VAGRLGETFRRLATRTTLRVGAARIATYLIIAAVAFAASWTRFPNFLFGCVDYAERGYLSLIDHMSVPELHGALRIIYIDDRSFADESTRGDVWRTRHARLLRELTRAGASVVAFDLAFEDQGKGDDALAAAIQEAGATRVIVGAEPPFGDADAVDLPVSPVLKAVLRPGQVASLSVGGSTSALATSVLRRRVLVAEASSGEGSSAESGQGPGAETGVIRVPEARATLPLQIKLAWEESRSGRSRALARIDAARDELVLFDGAARIESIPCSVRVRPHGAHRDQEATILLQRLRPTLLEQISKPYTLVESWIRDGLAGNFAQYRGKIVLIGSNIGDYTFQSPGETVYGYSIHASVVNSLLLGRHSSEPGIGWQFALLAVLASLAGTCRVAVPRGDVTIPIPAFGFKVPCPLTLLGMAGAYLLVAAAVYANTRTIVDVVYGAGAITAGYYVSKWAVLGTPRAAVSAAGERAAAPRPAARNRRARGESV
jgi:CHASE2 domain-containing sensor protein